MKTGSRLICGHLCKIGTCTDFGMGIGTSRAKSAFSLAIAVCDFFGFDFGAGLAGLVCLRTHGSAISGGAATAWEHITKGQLSPAPSTETTTLGESGASLSTGHIGSTTSSKLEPLRIMPKIRHWLLPLVWYVKGSWSSRYIIEVRSQACSGHS